MILVVSCGRNNPDDLTASGIMKDPIRIGVFTLGSVSEKDDSGKELDGIRVAHAVMPRVKDIPVELVVHTLGNVGEDPGLGVGRIAAEKDLKGLILCGSGVREMAWKIDQLPGDIPVIAPSWQQVFSGEHPGGSPVWSLAASLQDHARAAAVFITETLMNKKVAVILDETSSDCVLLSSLFAAQLLSAGGSIADIVSIAGGNIHSGSLDHLTRHRPEVVFLPYSVGTSKEVISWIASVELHVPIVVCNMENENHLLDAEIEMPESVYLIVDYHADAVQNCIARDFVRLFKKQHPKVHLSARAARGGEAYLILAELLSTCDIPQRNPRSVDGMGFGDHITGVHRVGDSGEIHTPLYAARVRTRFLRSTVLEYVGEINTESLDSGGDIGAE
ncbi:MAG: hypothetical protein ACP5G0_04090 [Desulfomonilia bacterium]